MKPLLPLLLLTSLLLSSARTAEPAAPAPITGLFIAPATLLADEVTLIWDKPELPAGITATYQVLRDDQPVGETATTHFTARGLAPDHPYTFALRATLAPSGETRLSAPLTLRTEPASPVVSVEKFGARGDGRTLNTRALQAAIDACPPGGTVLLPRGVFLSGALFLKSDMTLLLAEGAVLQGSANVADYEPFYRNRFEGWELSTYASLLNAGHLDHAGPANVRHLRIRGTGRITGGGAPLAKEMIARHGLRSRGRLICLMNCADVEIQGVTLEEPPSWTLHLIYSENITCHDVRILTAIRNGDGIDPDSCRHTNIVHCYFDTGDDCIAVKSGKNPEGNRLARPTENVRIIDCRFDRGHGISFGSEMSGGIRDVLVQDCVAGPLLNGLQIKATPARGGFVERVTVRDCDLQKISLLTSLSYNNDGEAAPQPPVFRDFRFYNLDLRRADPAKPAIIVHGFSAPGHRTHGVSFERLLLPAGAIIEVDEAEDISFRELQTSDNQPPTYRITRSERVTH